MWNDFIPEKSYWIWNTKMFSYIYLIQIKAIIVCLNMWLIKLINLHVKVFTHQLTNSDQVLVIRMQHAYRHCLTSWNCTIYSILLSCWSCWIITQLLLLTGPRTATTYQPTRPRITATCLSLVCRWTLHLDVYFVSR